MSNNQNRITAKRNQFNEILASWRFSRELGCIQFNIVRIFWIFLLNERRLWSDIASLSLNW